MNRLALTPEYDANLFARDRVGGIEESYDSTLESLRSFVNDVQAGDLRVDWTQVTKKSTIPIQSLGSRGKFLHPTHGIVMARYVRFLEPVSGQGHPCGFHQLAAPMWQVTNDYANCASSMVLGLMTTYEDVNSGEYGWILVSGPNFIEMRVKSPEKPEQGQWLSWYTTGIARQDNVRAFDSFAQVANADTAVEESSGIWLMPPASLLLRG